MLTYAEIEKCTNGKLLRGKPEEEIGRIVIDSRTLQPSEVFLAINGERFDGHDFIEQVAESGCLALIVNYEHQEKALATNTRWVLAVKDTQKALGRIANAWRHKVNPKVVAITGSNGKTSIKEMASFICSDSMNVLSTLGNQNNQIGMPLNLLRLGKRHDVAILEAGMNHRGELEDLASICDPDISVLANIGEAHIGNFRSPEDLVAAKAELLVGTRKEGLAIVGTDCVNTRSILGKFSIPHQVQAFGTGQNTTVRATEIQLNEPLGWSFTLSHGDESVSVDLQLFGIHQVQNALAAATIALTLGIDLQTIATRLSQFKAPKMRSQVFQVNGITLIEDCYNSSPSAVKSALRSLNISYPNRRRVVILGDMFELGRFEEDYHRQVGRDCIQWDVDCVIAVGQRARWITEEIKSFSSIKTVWAEDTPELEDQWGNILRTDDVVFIKGSRLCKLERISQFLQIHYRSSLVK